MDLEKKIDRHKKEGSTEKKQNHSIGEKEKGKNINVKNSSSPPLPKKMEAKSSAIAKPHHDPKPQKSTLK